MKKIIAVMVVAVVVVMLALPQVAQAHWHGGPCILGLAGLFALLFGWAVTHPQPPPRPVVIVQPPSAPTVQCFKMVNGHWEPRKSEDGKYHEEFVPEPEHKVPVSCQ